MYYRVFFFVLLLAGNVLNAQNKSYWAELIKVFPEKPRSSLIICDITASDTPSANRIHPSLLYKTMLFDSLSTKFHLSFNDSPLNKFQYNLPDFSKLGKIIDPIKLNDFLFLNYAIARGKYSIDDTTFLCIEFFQYHRGTVNRLCIILGMNNDFRILKCENIYQYLINHRNYYFSGYVNTSIEPVKIYCYKNQPIHFHDYHKYFIDNKTGEMLLMGEHRCFYTSKKSPFIQELLFRKTSDFRWEIAFPGDLQYSSLLEIDPYTMQYKGHDGSIQYFIFTDSTTHTLNNYYNRNLNFELKDYISKLIIKNTKLSNFSNSILKASIPDTLNIGDNENRSPITLDNYYLSSLVETLSSENKHKSINGFPDTSSLNAPNTFISNYNSILFNENYLIPLNLYLISENADQYTFLLIYYYYGYEWSGTTCMILNMDKKDYSVFLIKSFSSFYCPMYDRPSTLSIYQKTNFQITELNYDTFYSRIETFTLNDGKISNRKITNDHINGWFTVAYPNDGSYLSNIYVYRTKDSLDIMDLNLQDIDGLQKLSGRIQVKNDLNSTIEIPWNKYTIKNYEKYLLIGYDKSWSKMLIYPIDHFPHIPDSKLFKYRMKK